MMPSEKLSSLRLFGAAAALWFIVGCASSPPIQTIKSEGAKKNATLLMMNYEFESDHSVGTETGCKMRVRHVKTGEVYEVILDPQSKVALIEAPAHGSFERASIFCGFSRVWKIPKSWEAFRFRVYPNKVNYLGMFSLRLTKEATELKMGYHHDKDYPTFVQSVEDLSDDMRSRLVSAYTGKALTPKILGTPKSVYFPNIRVKAVKTVVEKVSESPDVSHCVQKEKHLNPIFFGRLSFQATYQKNKLARLVRTRNDHVYSEKFVRCVKRGIAAFKPNVDQRIEYAVEF